MNIHIDLSDKTQKISTSGGEGYLDYNYFTDIYCLHIGDLTIDFNSETALSIVNKLKEHLEVNGHKI